MSERGRIVKVSAARFERLLPGPASRVWDHLTRTELLPGWFGAGTIEPRSGGALSLMDGHIRGVVTQFQPPRFLAYTWNVFQPGETVSGYPESYLQLALDERGRDVLLTLTHFPIPEPFEKQTAMGWHTFLDILQAALAGEPERPRGDYMQKNAALYGVDLNNLAR